MRLSARYRQQRFGYVLAVAASHRVTTAAGTCPARAIAVGLPRRAWQRYSAGEGAKGYRYYDWAWLATDPGQPGHRYLLIRCNRRTGELAFYCYCPRRVCLPWSRSLEFAGPRRKLPGRQGPDRAGRAPVRRWDSWYRWTTLAMLALAFLTIVAASEHASPSPAHQIPLTRNEIAALFSTLIIDPGSPRWRDRQRRKRARCRQGSTITPLSLH